jgi:hypothetical protein
MPEIVSNPALGFTSLGIDPGPASKLDKTLSPGGRFLSGKFDMPSVLILSGAKLW